MAFRLTGAVMRWCIPALVLAALLVAKPANAQIGGNYNFDGLIGAGVAVAAVSEVVVVTVDGYSLATRPNGKTGTGLAVFNLVWGTINLAVGIPLLSFAPAFHPGTLYDNGWALLPSSIATMTLGSMFFAHGLYSLIPAKPTASPPKPLTRPSFGIVPARAGAQATAAWSF